MTEFKVNDRVQIVGTHRYNPGCVGTIVLVESRIGNRFTVELNSDPSNVWHNDEGKPCLRLGQVDLVLLEEDECG